MRELHVPLCVACRAFRQDCMLALLACVRPGKSCMLALLACVRPGTKRRAVLWFDALSREEARSLRSRTRGNAARLGYIQSRACGHGDKRNYLI
jgi:hypothetical protein